MRKGGGKQKGAAFERQICKGLSLWVSRGKNEDLFWRSAMSGGRSTVALKNKGTKLAAQAGDISSVHELGHKFIQQFMVECKSYKSLDYASLIKGKGNLLAFWDKARKEAKSYHKQPMLIAKQNNFPIVVCMTAATAAFLRADRLVVLTMPQVDLYIVLWDDFTKLNPEPRERVRL